MIHTSGCGVHDHCKVNVLRHLTERLGLSPEQILAVGDGENDVCMLKSAGYSVAFQPKTRNVRAAARHTASRMDEVLRLATRPFARRARREEMPSSEAILESN
jgi:phosphoserine phosphatase